MNLGKPVVPVRHLKCQGNFPRVQCLLEIHRPIAERPGKEIGQGVLVLVQHPFETGAGGPTADRLIVQAGARPVFVDIDPATHNLDPERLAAAITPATRAIMPVDLYGRMADLGAIGDLAARHGLPVIEDAAQAHGAWRAGVFLGLMDGRTDVDGRFGGLQARAGSTDVQSRHLGGYATWSDPDGFYADGVLQLGRHRYSVHPEDDTNSTARAHGVTVSLEAGKSQPVAAGWSFEPQAQVIYQASRFDDAQIGGATVQQQPQGRWTGRLGLRLKGDVATGAGRLQPYARVNLYRTSGGHDLTRFVGPAWTTDLAAGTGASAAELAAGFTLALSPTASAYGEMGHVAAIGGESRFNSSLQGGVGLKLRW